MRNFVVPNGTSVDAKLKLPCAVLTLNVTGLDAAETVTIMPFSCIGPVVTVGGGGARRVDTFHEVPEIESVPEKRQPCRPRIVAPVAVIEPSQVVGIASLTPKAMRYD